MITGRLAEVAEVAMAGTEADSVLLTGGDTAAAVLGRLGATGVEIFGELEPSVPFGIILGGRYDKLAVATKAGGFGDDDTLVRAMLRLSGGHCLTSAHDVGRTSPSGWA